MEAGSLDKEPAAWRLGSAGSLDAGGNDDESGCEDVMNGDKDES